MNRILVTGAGRGLGYEFVRQYLHRGDYVFAGFRDPKASTNLHALAVQYPNLIHLLTIDVTDMASIDASFNIVSQKVNGLDLLINNAGVHSRSKDMGENPANHCVLGQLDAQKMLAMFHVNTIAPIIVVQRYLYLLKNGVNPKVVNISSVRASLSGKTEGGNYSYCGSKVALNMLTRALAFDVAQWKIIAIAVDPGWVKTDMGGINAQLSPAESVQGIIGLIDNVNELDTGGFFNWRGEKCLW
jgi:NAD(P)-dependent dehydrogenase (short-subunit alcohol dehydrogenase family)